MSAKGSSEDNNAQSKLTIDGNQTSISGNIDITAKNNVVRVYKEESLNNPEASKVIAPYLSIKETLYAAKAKAQRESIKNEEQKEEDHDLDELQEMLNELKLVIRDSINNGSISVWRQKMINAKLFKPH